ncbi:MAG: recombinase family protein [Clostridia bacterium]|nr:recombinase family protein [Clostridia bacterium]
MVQLEGVAYARYSSDRQQESSIVVQLAEIRRFCERHNIHLRHEYVDEAQTGTNANRKSFQEMIKDAEKREFRFVIVHRMDRWARNVDDARYYKKYLRKYGIKVVSTIEEFDETPEGEFFELMSMGMAELYSKKLARECRAGMLANAREAKVHGGVPLLGYRVQNKKYVIEEKEADIVRLIFNLFLQGYGYVEIRNYLYANGYRRADGRVFTAHFYDILRNRKYIGEYAYNVEAERDERGIRNKHKSKPESEIIRIPDGVPRIIDDDTFFRVQAIMDERKQRRKYFNPNGKYLFAGLMKCGCCDGSVCGGVRYNYKGLKVGRPHYQCNRRDRKCPTTPTNAEYLETYVYRLLSWCLFKKENSQKLIDLVRVSYIKTYENMQAEYNALLAKIDEKQAKIKENCLKETQEEMKSLRAYLAEENCAIRWEINELTRSAQLLNERISMYPEFKPKRIIKMAESYLDRIRMTSGKTSQVAYRELIHLITMDNNEIRITFNLQRLLDGIERIPATVIEVRNNIAHPNKHACQALEFCDLKVQI